MGGHPGRFNDGAQPAEGSRQNIIAFRDRQRQVTTRGDDIQWLARSIDNLAPRNIKGTTEMGTTWVNRCRWIAALLPPADWPRRVCRGGRAQERKQSRGRFLGEGELRQADPADSPAQCQGCHQPAKAGGGYVMTAFEAMVKGGESDQAAIVPGKPTESYLFEQITPHDGKAAMPQNKPPLSTAEIELIGAGLPRVPQMIRRPAPSRDMMQTIRPTTPACR